MSIENPFHSENKEIPKILRIGVDLDDTVLDYGHIYFRAIAIGLGVNIPKLYPSFSGRIRDISEIANRPNGIQFIENLLQREIFYKVSKPIPGAIETLNKWRGMNHEIWFITARNQSLSAVTFAWLEKHGLDWAVERTFLKDNPSITGGEYKNEICQRLRADVFIDDMPRYLDAINAPCVRLKIGLKKPWNTESYEEDKNGYSLVNNWSQIASRVELLM